VELPKQTGAVLQLLSLFGILNGGLLVVSRHLEGILLIAASIGLFVLGRRASARAREGTLGDRACAPTVT